jgi:hypothetical protein
MSSSHVGGEAGILTAHPPVNISKTRACRPSSLFMMADALWISDKDIACRPLTGTACRRQGDWQRTMCDVPSQIKDALLRFDDLRAHYGRIYALATRSSSVTPARLALVVSPLATNAIAWSISATSTRYTHHPRSLPSLEGREVHRRHQGVRMHHDRCRVNDVGADLVVAAL